MRLYVMHKGQHLLTAIMVLCLFFIALLMGMAGPRITTEHKEYARTLPRSADKAEAAAATTPDNGSLATGPYDILTPRLTVYRQQLWLSAQVKLGASDQESFAKPFQVKLTSLS